MTVTRKLAAILAADVAGYSRLMGTDEEGTLERLKAHRRELIDPKIAEHHGRIVLSTAGTGRLLLPTRAIYLCPSRPTRDPGLEAAGNLATVGLIRCSRANNGRKRCHPLIAGIFYRRRRRSAGSWFPPVSAAPRER